MRRSSVCLKTGDLLPLHNVGPRFWVVVFLLHFPSAAFL